MAKQSSTFRFKNKASHPKNAVALVYDLEGFSNFFNQPDVQEYVPEFLNHISESISICLFGGKAYWTDEKYSPLAINVAQEKFMGDGALYVILPNENKFSDISLQVLCNRLWNLKTFFGKVSNKAMEIVPVTEIPQKIRFGLSRGSVYELKHQSSRANEYIGFCINLSSRLQSYCRDIGFIASARIKIPDSQIEKNGYIKVIATAIDGFANELVIVDKSEYEGLTDKVRKSLFKEITEP